MTDPLREALRAIKPPSGLRDETLRGWHDAMGEVEAAIRTVPEAGSRDLVALLHLETCDGPHEGDGPARCDNMAARLHAKGVRAALGDSQDAPETRP